MTFDRLLMGEIDSRCSTERRERVVSDSVAMEVLESLTDSVSTDCFRQRVGEVVGDVTAGGEGISLGMRIAWGEGDELLLNADIDVTWRNWCGRIGELGWEASVVARRGERRGGFPPSPFVVIDKGDGECNLGVEADDLRVGDAGVPIVDGAGGILASNGSSRSIPLLGSRLGRYIWSVCAHWMDL